MEHLDEFPAARAVSPGLNVGAGLGSGAKSGEEVCLSGSSTKMETVRFMHRWRIEQFPVHLELSQIGESLNSSTFGSEDGRYKFLLKLFPAGRDEECRGYLSLYLQIQRCPSQKLRFRVNFYIDTTDGPKSCTLNKNVVTINKGGTVTASKFFGADSLKNRSHRYMPEESLTVGVELTVFGEHQSVEVAPDESEAPLIDVEPPPALQGSLGHDLGTLLETKDHADCTLYVGERKFVAHKAILGVRSPVFGAMWGHSENQEAQMSEAHLEDVTPAAIASLLEFVYKDSCSDLAIRADEILAAADKYCMDKLKKQCEISLSSDLAHDNVCYRLKLADAYSAPTLRKRCLLYFRKNRGELLNSKDWSLLEAEQPSLAATILKDLVMVQEESVYRVSLGEPTLKRPRLQ